MISVSVQDVKDKMKEIGATLVANDQRFRRSVHLVTIDSTQLYRHAFVVTWEGYYLLFTEHHGYHFEHTDEVLWCIQFAKDLPIEELK